MDRGYSLEPSPLGSSNVYPGSMFKAKKIIKISLFSSEKYHFYSLEILHGHVCVMKEKRRPLRVGKKISLS